MKKEHQLTTYVDDRINHEIESFADDEGLSKSAATRKLLEQAIMDRKQGEVSADVRAAQQLQRVIDDGKREIQRATRHMSEIAALASVYSAANFELVKQGHGQAARRQALDTGRRRTQANVDDRPIAIEFGDQFVADVLDDQDGGDDEESQGLDFDSLEG